MTTKRLAFAAAAAVVALHVRCGSDVNGPPACAPIDGGVVIDDDTVWGIADLHAHPAIERAFDGRMVWGTALDPEPVNADELPAIEPCPVETHDRNASAPLDRAVGAKVFPHLSELGGYAHGPVGSVGSRTTTAWPNARDVIHQEMNVASIRRAYEAGVRLLFASTTDDQVIGALLHGPNLDDGFVPDPAADYASAKTQVDLIQAIVAQNASWMGIATTPHEARVLIQDGKLALVLSLEMEGLRESDVDRLYQDYGVRHIIPIHLVDNDVGGTAANGDLFNAASAELSSLYSCSRAPRLYMQVAPTAFYARALGWPMQVASLQPAPLYVDLVDIPYAEYATTCYEPLDACAGPTAAPRAPFIELGQENRKGLYHCDGEETGAQRIRHLIQNGMFVDVSHMGARSVADTLAVDPDFPFIASHGGVANLCEGNPTLPPCEDLARDADTERSLDGEAARSIVRRRGVLGFGTGVNGYGKRTVFAVRGGPVFTLEPGAPPACVAAPDGTNACEVVPEAVPETLAAAQMDTLRIQTDGGPAFGGVDPNARPFVRVELRAQVPATHVQKRVFVAPLDCSSGACSASVRLGLRDRGVGGDCVSGATSCGPIDCDATGTEPYTVDDLESVTLEWLYLQCDADCQQKAGAGVALRQCASTWADDRAPSWPIEQVDVAFGHGADPTTTLVHLGPRTSRPLVTLDRGRGKVVVYDRHDRPDTARDLPVSGHLLRVTMRTSSGSDLLGASPARTGAEVCVAPRAWQGTQCAPTAPPPAAGSTECPAGWTNFNQRGEWSGDVPLYTFVRFPGDPTSLCGLDVSVVDWDGASAPVSVDQVLVEAIEDPVGHWVRRYAQIADHVAGGELGVVALGTDFNGLNGMLDISELPVPGDAIAPSACGTVGTSAPWPSPLAPMRIRNADGTLGAPVLIDERGLATYGLLADFLALVKDYPGCGPDVYDSLMLSAEATLRAWEKFADPGAYAKHELHPLPSRRFTCGGSFVRMP